MRDISALILVLVINSTRTATETKPSSYIKVAHLLGFGVCLSCEGICITTTSYLSCCNNNCLFYMLVYSYGVIESNIPLCLIHICTKRRLTKRTNYQIHLTSNQSLSHRLGGDNQGVGAVALPHQPSQYTR